MNIFDKLPSHETPTPPIDSADPRPERCLLRPQGTGQARRLGRRDDAYPFRLTDSTGHKRSLNDISPRWFLLMIFYRGIGARPAGTSCWT